MDFPGGELAGQSQQGKGKYKGYRTVNSKADIAPVGSGFIFGRAGCGMENSAGNPRRKIDPHYHKRGPRKKLYYRQAAHGLRHGKHGPPHFF